METDLSFWQMYGSDILQALVMSAVVFLLFLFVGMILLHRVFPMIEKRLDGEKHKYIAILLKGFRRPLSFFLKIACIISVLLTLCVLLPEDGVTGILGSILLALPGILIPAFRILTVITVAWGLVSSSEITSLIFRNAKNFDLHMSKSVSRFLSAVFNVVIIAIAAVILLHEFNYDINGLIAGLGLGGLTIALAAQNSASNFFGGLVIVLEKPFEIGDWISCSEVEGTVEDISLRSTRIRNSAGALTTVPNSTLSDEVITNWTCDMEKRRADFKLRLTYGTTAERIREYGNAVTNLLKTDPEVLKDSPIVRFTDFTDSSLDLTVIYYTAVPGYSDYLRIKERLNFSIMELAKQYGICFAYPTTTVFLEKEKNTAT